MVRHKFGWQRATDHARSRLDKMLYHLIGVGDPAHYLHWRYLDKALGKLAPRERDILRILDAGCGSGDYTFYLAERYPKAKVLGVDISEELVARNRRTAVALELTNVEFRVADLAREEFSEAFDLIVSIDVLEHIPHQENALANLCGALVPGGIVFLHVPTIREHPVPFHNWLQPFREWAEREHIAQERTASELAAMVGNQITLRSVQRTFGYYTGELATSLFALPYANTLMNRVFQGLLAPICRLLAMADLWQVEKTRYAVAILAERPRSATA